MTLIEGLLLVTILALVVTAVYTVRTIILVLDLTRYPTSRR